MGWHCGLLLSHGVRPGHHWWRMGDGRCTRCVNKFGIIYRCNGKYRMSYLCMYYVPMYYVIYTLHYVLCTMYLPNVPIPSIWLCMTMYHQQHSSDHGVTQLYKVVCRYTIIKWLSPYSWECDSNGPSCGRFWSNPPCKEQLVTQGSKFWSKTSFRISPCKLCTAKAPHFCPWKPIIWLHASTAIDWVGLVCSLTVGPDSVQQ